MKKTTLVALTLMCVEIFADSLQSRLNIINGASAECVMHKFYANSGWTRIEGEIGRNGIDGLYFKKRKDVIREVLVAESKWNTSRLGLSGKDKTVRQMSREWIERTLKRLQKHKPISEYAPILKLVQNGQYRARLFRLKPIMENAIQITIYKIKNRGLKTFHKISHTKLPPININEPKNTFERGITRAYNECRRKYFYKYMPSLSKKEVDSLLKDNYLKKRDFALKKYKNRTHSQQKGGKNDETVLRSSF